MPNYTNTPGIAFTPFYILKKDVKQDLELGDLVSLMTNYGFAAWAKIMDITSHEYVLMLDTTDPEMFIEDTEVLNIVERHEAESRPEKEVEEESEEDILEDGKIKRFYINLGGKEYYIDLDEWELFQKWKEKYNLNK